MRLPFDRGCGRAAAVVRRRRPWGLVVLGAALLAACGGGDRPVPATTPRAHALGVVATVPAPSAEALFNWAEREHPAYFPGPASTLSEGDWLYRAYLASGVMLGVRDGQVHLVGGPFGPTLVAVGRVTDYVQPALRVWPTSYENKHRLPFDDTQLPTVRALGIPKLFDDEGDSNERSIVLADFFQEGQVSAFVTSGRVAHLYGPQDVPDIPGVAYFLRRDAQGRWVDRSAQLLKTAQDRVACVSSSYALVADFNEDAKPDVFVSCTGVDHWYEHLAPEQQRVVQTAEQLLFLSQRDGGYRRSTLPGAIYGHHASAFDVDGDGHVDIVTTDAWNANDRLPFVWRGRGDGRFIRDDRIIDRTLTQQLPTTNTFWNAFGVPRDGRVDLVLAGQDVTVLVRADGRGGFDLAHPLTFERPTSAAKRKPYAFPLDVYWDDARRRFDFHSTAGDAAGEEWAVLQFDESGTHTATLDLWLNDSATLQPYAAQFKATADGALVAYTGGCWLAPTAGACGWRVGR